VKGAFRVDIELEHPTRDVDRAFNYAVPRDFVFFTYVYEDDAVTAKEIFRCLYAERIDGGGGFRFIVIDTFDCLLRYGATSEESDHDQE